MEPNTTPQNTNNTNSNKPFYITAAILIPVAIAGYLLFGKSNEAVAPTTTTPNPTDSATEGTPEATPAEGDTSTNSKYKDGTYSVKGVYTSPAGPEEFPVTITLAGDKITDATMTVNSENKGSVNFQTQFKDNFKEFVIGKNIDEVVLTKVSGSSLTPKGFNDALAKVKTEAKS